ncbi:hypothetical protein ACIPVB_07780 [Microbacterium sp. NPDC090007]|uniref:hypothetical protein n=1 Tax=Microbacterium sp. NPDC090007 TaxID=3364204 RepID=UPI003830ABED
MRGANKSWVIAGALLLVSMLLRGVSLGVGFRISTETAHLVTTVSDALAGAGILLLAVGLTRAESVVDRRPLGLVAMVVLAVWPLAAAGIAPVLPQMDRATYDRGLDAYRAAESALTAFWLAGLIVPLVASLVAALAVRRSPTVPRGWGRLVVAVWVSSVLLGAVQLWSVPLWWLHNLAPLGLVGLLSMVAGFRVRTDADDHTVVARTGTTSP